MGCSQKNYCLDISSSICWLTILLITSNNCYNVIYKWIQFQEKKIEYVCITKGKSRTSESYVGHGKGKYFCFFFSWFWPTIDCVNPSWPTILVILFLFSQNWSSHIWNYHNLHKRHTECFQYKYRATVLDNLYQLMCQLIRFC